MKNNVRLDALKNAIGEHLFFRESLGPGGQGRRFKDIGCFIAWRETTDNEMKGVVDSDSDDFSVYSLPGGESEGQLENWNSALEPNDKMMFVWHQTGTRYISLAISTNDDSGLVRYRFGIQVTPEVLQEMVRIAREAGWYNKPHTTQDERDDAMLKHSDYNPLKPD